MVEEGVAGDKDRGEVREQVCGLMVVVVVM